MLVAGSLALIAASAGGWRLAPDDFAWSEPMPAGSLLRIHYYQGPVEVRGSSGGHVEVRARGSAAAFHFQVVRSGSDVTICAMPREGAECRADALRTASRERVWRRGTAEFEVLLPKGVRIAARTDNGPVAVSDAGAEATAVSGNGPVRVYGSAAAVRASTGNGAVRVSGAGGPVTARTRNGSVQVSTAAGPVRVHTGNGGIDVRMSTLGTPGEMHFRTGNGRVVVRLPGDAERDVDVTTGSGSFGSDFGLHAWPQRSRHHARGRIGRGGAVIYLASGRGPIELRRVE
jgi:hypothetical protein